MVGTIAQTRRATQKLLQHPPEEALAAKKELLQIQADGESAFRDLDSSAATQGRANEGWPRDPQVSSGCLQRSSHL